MIGAFNARKLVIWHAIAHTYSAMIVIIDGHVAMDCPDKILPLGT